MKIINSIPFFFFSLYIHTYTRSFILSAILSCIYHCAGRLTPKLQENSQMYMQCTSFKVMADSPKHNGSICYFSSSDKTKEIQGNEESNASEEETDKELSAITLANKKTRTEAECSKIKQKAWIQKFHTVEEWSSVASTILKMQSL